MAAEETAIEEMRGKAIEVCFDAHEGGSISGIVVDTLAVAAHLQVSARNIHPTRNSQKL